MLTTEIKQLIKRELPAMFREEHQKERDEQNRKWEEQNRKWHEKHKAIERTLNTLDGNIGAIGSQWGLQPEEAFRTALKGILEQSFGVEVLNVNEFDESGEVFGRPDQVELDVIIKNGLLIVCELKSSMSRSDVYTFDRKVKFYERTHQRTATRRLIITPMMRDDARRTAFELGIEVFSYAQDAAL